MPEEKWTCKKRHQEGDKVWMPGDVYDGSLAKVLGPNHPWIKAGWFELEKPAPETDEPPKKEDAEAVLWFTRAMGAAGDLPPETKEPENKGPAEKKTSDVDSD